MKWVWPLILLVPLMHGCITLAPCSYCGESRYADVEQNRTEELAPGITKGTKTRIWYHYYMKDKELEAR